MRSSDPKVLNTMGCNAGQSGRAGFIALFWGRPTLQNTQYGTVQLDTEVFLSTSKIESLVKEWIEGFWRCKTASSKIELSIATSSDQIDVFPGSISNHGREWGLLVERLQIYAKPYIARLTISGGVNAELDFAKPLSSHAWIDAYSAASTMPLYVVGDCASCPTKQQTFLIPNNGWSVEDIWYLVWSGRSFPFPQIYTTDGTNARQWQYIADWARRFKSSDVDFMGVLTQDDACATNGPCPTTRNTPEDAWTQLWTELNSYDSTVQPTIKWLSDVSWGQQ